MSPEGWSGEPEVNGPATFGAVPDGHREDIGGHEVPPVTGLEPQGRAPLGEPPGQRVERACTSFTSTGRSWSYDSRRAASANGTQRTSSTSSLATNGPLSAASRMAQ